MRPKRSAFSPAIERRQLASCRASRKKRSAAFAPPPFTTSKLQQAGYNRLRYTAKRTMMLAQRLYEGVELGDEGSVALITYMRTDSVRVSNDALAQVREHIGSSYGGKIPARKAQLLQIEERCAGSARSHSSHRRGAHAGKRAAVSARTTCSGSTR